MPRLRHLVCCRVGVDDHDREKDTYGNTVGMIGEDWLRLNFN